MMTYTYAPPRTTTTDITPPAFLGSLPTGVLSAGATHYAGYYGQVTNDFDTTVPLIESSYFQTDPTQGGETDYILVVTATTVPTATLASGVVPRSCTSTFSATSIGPIPMTSPSCVTVPEGRQRAIHFWDTLAGDKRSRLRVLDVGFMVS